MKRIMKTIVCLAIAASLCIAGTSMAWAGESSADFSLDDLLNLLSDLTADSSSEESESLPEETAAVDVEADLTTLTIGSFSFDIPTAWYETEEEENGMYTYYSPEYDKWISVNYSDELAETDQIDVTDPDQVEMIAQIFAQGVETTNTSAATVCGLDAMLLEFTSVTGESEIESRYLIIPYGTELLMLSFGGFDDVYPEFKSVAESFVISGADGETDLSGASASLTASNTESGTPKTDTAEILDGTTGELVLVDDDACTVTIKNFSTDDDYYGMTAKVFVENKTDINLYVSFDDVSVNDYMCEPWWGTSVSAGHKSNSELHFTKDVLAENNITDIRSLELTVLARDDDDYSADYVVNKNVVIYPFGTDVPEQPAQTFDDDDIVMVDNDQFTMILTGFSEDDYYVYGNVYLENKTDIKVEFSVSGDSTVNGYEISPYFYQDIMPGKKTNTSMTWSIRDLDENEIETIEDMELDLVISESDNWSADPLYEDVVYITFS